MQHGNTRNKQGIIKLMNLNNKIKYIVDENDKKVAVQMDIDVFEAIENFIEDHGLELAMDEVSQEETIDFEEGLKILKKSAS